MRRTVLFAFLIILLGVVAYGNSLSGKFICDDLTLVQYNPFIRASAVITKLFGEDIAAGGNPAWQSNSYRPLQMSFYAAEYPFWKDNPAGYHLSNILLHILVALGIFWLITLLFNKPLLSFLTSALFAVHPIHTGAVSYIAGRADPLAALFMIFGLICYIKYLEGKGAEFYFFMLFSYMAALFSRESALILPFIFLFYHYAFGKKVRVRDFFPLIASTLFYFVLRLLAVKSLLPRIIPSGDLSSRLTGFLAALTEYTRLLFFPLGLHMEYGKATFNFGDPKVIAGLILFVALIWLAVAARKRNPVVFFGIGWFFITLFPSSNIFPLTAYMAEHWLYIPSIGFFLVLSNVLVFIYAKKPRYIAVAIAAVLIFSYAFLTIRQNHIYWREPIAFYTRTLEYAPQSIRMYNNLGIEYCMRGKKKEAIEVFKKGLEVNPNSAILQQNLSEAQGRF